MRLISYLLLTLLAVNYTMSSSSIRCASAFKCDNYFDYLMTPKHFRTTVLKEVVSENFNQEKIDVFENEIVEITQQDGVAVIKLSQEFKKETVKIEEVLNSTTFTITGEADLKALSKLLETTDFADVAGVIEDFVQNDVIHLIDHFFKGNKRDKKKSSCNDKCLNKLNMIYDMHLKIAERVKQKVQKKGSMSRKRKFKKCKREKKMLLKMYKKETKGLKRRIAKALNNYTKKMTKDYCRD